MKLIHCSDLHLDSKMESNLSTEKAKKRRGELFETFSRMVDYADDSDVRIIIIAGDMFDEDRNTQIRIKRRVLDRIVNSPNIDFLYLRGNHDRVNFFESLEEKPKNLKLFTDEWTILEYDNLSIAGVELYKTTDENIYGKLFLNEDRINIVVLHGQESQYSHKTDGEIINLNLLQNINIDYLALGHIHQYKYEKLDKRGFYCYSGCLEGRGFDELGDKGFVLLNIKDKEIKHEFIPFAKRVFHQTNISLEDVYSEIEIENAIDMAIQDISEKDLIKVVLEGDVDESLDIDINYLARRYQDRFYFIKIYDDTKLKINYEDYINDISLKGEFIRLVEKSDFDDKEKKKIILTGLKALSGREVDL